MTNRKKTGYITGLELDANWINDSLLIPRDSNREDLAISDLTFAWMFHTTADTKFTNTTLGGNFSINNPPQFTTFADPPTGLFATTNDNAIQDMGMDKGMGQYYSEAIDDNAHLVTLRFGMPEYKGLFTFFTGFYNIRLSTLATEGRMGFDICYFVGRVVGGIIALPVNALLFLNKAARFFLNKPSTKYYWMKPTMNLYWNRVNLVANHLAAKMGIVPDSDLLVSTKDSRNPLADLGIKENSHLDDGTKDKYISYSYNTVLQQLPDMFNESGGIDIYRIAHKANRVDAAAKQLIQEAGETAGSTQDFVGAVRAHIKNMSNFSNQVAQETMSLNKYHELYHGSILGADTWETPEGEQYDLSRRDMVSDVINEKTQEAISNQSRSDILYGEEGDSDTGGANDNALGLGRVSKETVADYAEQDSYIRPVVTATDSDDGEITSKGGVRLEDDPQLDSLVKSAFTKGAEYISFKVDHVSTVNESWSNSVGEAQITSTINGISETTRSARFGFSDFKSGFAVLDTPLQMITDTLGGVLDSFNMSGLAALAGTGKVDIPKVYQDSTVSLPTASYSMELRTAYGDPLSIYLNLYVPLICLMAGALPISHGNQSYGAPMLCQLFDKGRNNIRLGMIESLSVSRGEGDVGWNEDGLPLGLDVSFSVVDMSSIMHMPIDTGLTGILPLSGIFDDDNAYTDYMSTLSGLNIYDMTNPGQKMSINRAIKRINTDQFFNLARVSNRLASGNIQRFITNTFTEPPVIATR